jgi:hypothetical protein
MAGLTRWNRVALGLGALFLIVGVGQFASSLFAARCLDAGRPAAERVWSCGVAGATTLARFSAADRPEYARIMVERAVTLAETGAGDQAAQVLAVLSAEVDGPVAQGRLLALDPASSAQPVLAGWLAVP